MALGCWELGRVGFAHEEIALAMGGRRMRRSRPCWRSRSATRRLAQQAPALVIEWRHAHRRQRRRHRCPTRWSSVQGNKITAVSRKGQDADSRRRAGSSTPPASSSCRACGIRRWPTAGKLGEALLNPRHHVDALTWAPSRRPRCRTATPCSTARTSRPRSYHRDPENRIARSTERRDFEMPLNTIRKPTSARGHARDRANRAQRRRRLRHLLRRRAAVRLLQGRRRRGAQDGQARVRRARTVRESFRRRRPMLGAAQLPHSAGIPLAIAKNPSQFRQGRDDRNELDKYADMDDAKAADARSRRWSSTTWRSCRPS